MAERSLLCFIRNSFFDIFAANLLIPEILFCGQTCHYLVFVIDAKIVVDLFGSNKDVFLCVKDLQNNLL